MASTELSAPRPRNQGDPRTSPHSGVIHVKEFQPDKYAIIGNHLTQHRELSWVAKGIGAYILSLREGERVDIRTLVDNEHEGRDRVATALRELEAHGYLKRVRERVAGGRMVTRTYAYNAPELTRARLSQPQEEALLRPCPPSVEERHCPVEPAASEDGAAAGEEAEPDAVPEVVLRAVPDPPAPAGAEPVADPEPVTEPEPEPVTDPVTEPEPPRDEHRDKAEVLLTGLRRRDSRFRLPENEVRRLIPLATAWFENGLGTADVLDAITSGAPLVVTYPAGFVASRLKKLLPPPLPPLPEPVGGLSVAVGPSLLYGFVDCLGECNRVFRAAEPGYCRDCRKRLEADRLRTVTRRPDAPSTQRHHPCTGPGPDGNPGGRTWPTRAFSQSSASG